MERLCEQTQIDLYYGDESCVSLTPCVPYGWQFKDETVSMPGTSGKGVNCFALLSRASECWFRTTQESVTACVLCGWLDRFAAGLRRRTVVVLDNAPVHRSKLFASRRATWALRGLFVFFLPPYSPQLNIAEILWRRLK